MINEKELIEMDRLYLKVAAGYLRGRSIDFVVEIQC